MIKQQVLLADFGSTFTKLCLIDPKKQTLIATASSYTTSQSHIKHGFNEALKELHAHSPITVDYQQFFACSSAWGGFRMVAIGLTKDLTTEAAKRAALGAGTRILQTFSYRLKQENINEINQLMPDIILLTGGTDGGNDDIICHNAQMLAQLEHAIPIVVAGNQMAIPAIKKIFQNDNDHVYYTENVMPKVNVLNALPTRLILRQIFMEKIVTAKGLGDIAQLTDKPIIPTPQAVLNAAELLSQGYDGEAGWGDLVIIDIGGATTDVHSIGSGLPTSPDIQIEGLAEPFVKRTVEGDLGMRYSAYSLLESVGSEKLNQYMNVPLTNEQWHTYCRYRSQHPDWLVHSAEEQTVDQAIAQAACYTAIRRHVGRLRRETSPTRYLYFQSGKDLTQINALIGTGGVIIHQPDHAKILQSALQTDSNVLAPAKPDCLIDHHYLLSALGLLAEVEPECALHMLKQYLQPII